MKPSSTAIGNVYVMMAYAFRAISEGEISRVSSENFDHLHELCAEIISREVSTQVKRGMHHDYRRRTDELRTVRGQISMTSTMAARSARPGSVVCTFDEYHPDTEFNRALKSVMTLLLRHGSVSKTRQDALRRLLPYFDQVQQVPPRSIPWTRFTFDRTTTSYRLLLGVCRMVVEGLIPSEGADESPLRDWLPEEAMSALYERFLREYCIFHHPDLEPRAKSVAWHVGAESAIGAEQLPQMKTDVTLTCGHRTLIIDAKYYQSPLQTGQFGKETVRSAHLYQILTYVTQEALATSHDVSGLLLYAQTDASSQPNVDLLLGLNRIGAKSLNLNEPWPSLREELESIISWVQDEPPA